jgi:hypothetical protein
MMGDMMCGNRRLSESNTADFEFDFWNSNQLGEMLDYSSEYAF